MLLGLHAFPYPDVLCSNIERDCAPLPLCTTFLDCTAHVHMLALSTVGTLPERRIRKQPLREQSSEQASSS